MTPRPMPLVMVGTPIASTKRSAAASAQSAQTSVPRISSGRAAPASSPAIRSTASLSGSAPRPAPTTGTEPVPTLKNSSIGTSTYVGPRWDDRAAVNASWKPAATSLAVISVAACLVTGPTIGRWSISWRAPVPQRLLGARPPTTTIGEPANWAWAIALTPLVTPGPAVSTARPGTRVSLPVASAANAAVCSWRTSSSRIGRPSSSAFTAPSYIGKTWAPDSVNMVSTPCAWATATASCPAWPVSSVEVMDRNLPTRRLGHSAADGPAR